MLSGLPMDTSRIKPQGSFLMKLRMSDHFLELELLFKKHVDEGRLLQKIFSPGRILNSIRSPRDNALLDHLG